MHKYKDNQGNVFDKMVYSYKRTRVILINYVRLSTASIFKVTISVLFISYLTFTDIPLRHDKVSILAYT